MKKISVLILALAMSVCAAVAAPLTKKANPVRIGQQQPITLSTNKLMQYLTGVNAAEIPTIATPFVGMNKAESADIDLEANELFMGTIFGEGWWIGIRNEQYSLYLYLINPEPGRFDGTYTENEMSMGFTYLHDNETGENFSFWSVNVVTVGEDPQSTCEITGSGTLQNGDVVNFHYQKLPPIEPVATVEVTGEVETFAFLSDDYDGKSCITVNGDNKLFTLVYTGTIGSDMILEDKYSGYTDLATGEFCALDHGVASATVLSDAMSFTASMVCKDAIEYVLTFNYPIQVVDTKNVEVHNLEVTSFLGLATLFQGSNDEYSTVQGMMVPEPAPGDFTDAMVFGLSKSDGSYTSSLAVTSCILSLDEDGGYVVDATFIGDDLIDYTVHMDFTVPEVTEDRDYVTNHGIFNDLTEDLDILQIYVEGNNRFSVVLDMEELQEGHYNQFSEQYKKNFCNIVLDYNNNGGTNLPMYWGEFDLTYDSENFAFTGECQAGNILFHVNITGPLERVTGNAYDNSSEDLAENFLAEEITVCEYDSENGYYTVRAVRADGSDTFATRIFVEGDELPAGVYPLSDSRELGTALSGEFLGASVDPTFYVHLTPEGYAQLPLWLCVEGTVTISYDDNGVISVVCEARNTWNCQGRFTINEQVSNGVENVEVSQNAVNGKFLEDGRVIIRHDGKKFNVVGQSVK